MTAVYVTGQPGELTPEPSMTYDIGVDIDDVLYPWFLTAHDLCVEAGITNGVVARQWRMYEDYGIEADLWISVLDKATRDGSLYTQAPIEGSVEALRRLLFAGHRIHLITARGTGAWQTLEQTAMIERYTREWVEEWAVPHDTLTFASDKAALVMQNGLDYFIDDAVHNFESISLNTHGCETYLMTAPHNTDYWTPFRLDTVSDFADLIIEASEKGARS